MPIDHTLAGYSDLSFRSAFAVYVVALIVSLIYYVRSRSLIEARREAAEEGVETPDFARKRSGLDKLGGMTQTLVWLGLIIHFASVVLRGMSAHRFPWGNLYEYISLVTVMAVAVASVVLLKRDLRVMWPWVLTLILALMFYGGTKLYAEAAPLVPALKSPWFPYHVSSVSIGASIGMISGMASILYLIRRAQPRGEEHGFLGTIAKPLPSAKTLDNIAYKAAIWALPIFGLGIILGAIWADAAWNRFWNWDPKETVSFITWILYAAYLHARATSGWKNHFAAWINILAFATMVFNLFFINLVTSGLHSYAGLS